MTIPEKIQSGRTYLGIELGSTRIKAVLIDDTHAPIAFGSHTWENRLENGIWTYRLEEVWDGLRACYRALAAEVKERYGLPLKAVGAMGLSARMHGYMAFDKQGELLVPYRTWRNTMTAEASEKLTQLFQFAIPQRWSIAHLYQAILNKEPHVKDLARLTTLAGYVHYSLTGENVLGVGEASGMFPIDSSCNRFHEGMLERFSQEIAPCGFPWKIQEILPRVLTAGEDAGRLTPEGARLLDDSGILEAGIPFCPPEGDAGTGMTATDSVAVRTGNVSAGTSIFAMIVLEKPLSRLHPEIDMVTTPDGKPVAMVHCNNCTTDIDAWVSLFGQACSLMGLPVTKGELYDRLYGAALQGEADGGGLLACNYHSGEPLAGFEEGRPLFVRTPGSRLSLANFMRAHLYAALVTLRLGMDILTKEEQVTVEKILGHGGLFKTEGVGQRFLAAAIRTPVSVMETAGEGGAWGMALLAAYRMNGDGESLDAYLERRVFQGIACRTLSPEPADAEGFDRFTLRFQAGLGIEKAAVEAL